MVAQKAKQMAKQPKRVTALGNEKKTPKTTSETPAFVAYRNGVVVATANSAEAAQRAARLNPNFVFVQVAETTAANTLPLGDSQPQSDTSEQ